MKQQESSRAVKVRNALIAVCLAALGAGCSTTTAAGKSDPVTTPSASASSTTINSIGLPPGVPGDLPSGVYKVKVNEEDLKAVNVAADEWSQMVGTYAWTLDNGTWNRVRDPQDDESFPPTRGVYVVDGDHITFLVAQYLGPQEFTWKVSGDKSLVFTALPSTSGFFAAYLASHALVPTS